MGSFWDGFFTQQSADGTPQMGWGLNALNTGAGLMNSWLGFQQLSQAKDMFKFQKNAWNKQYNDQVTLANAQMRDRQLSRYSAAPGFYQSPEEYMAQNQIGRG